MSPRQLIFLAAVGALSLLAAVYSGPIVLDALLGDTLEDDAVPENTTPPSGNTPHPAAAP